MGRILSIDFGTRRIGLAISDPGRILGMPFRTVVNEDQAEAIREIAAICREEEVDHLLLGYPLGRDGGPTALGREVDAFAAELEKASGLSLERSDERFTSTEAEDVLRQLGRSGRHRNRRERKNGSKDQVAAALLLQDWIQNHV
jgi:putative Holliday junction resolvase